MAASRPAISMCGLIVTLPDKPDGRLKEFAATWKPDYDPRAKLK